MKVYISGPITGHDDYMERFEEAEQEIRNKFGDNIEVVNKGKSMKFKSEKQQIFKAYH